MKKYVVVVVAVFVVWFFYVTGVSAYTIDGLIADDRGVDLNSANNDGDLESMPPGSAFNYIILCILENYGYFSFPYFQHHTFNIKGMLIVKYCTR